MEWEFIAPVIIVVVLTLTVGGVLISGRDSRKGARPVLGYMQGLKTPPKD